MRIRKASHLQAAGLAMLLAIPVGGAVVVPPSTQPPGGLLPTNTPQIVLLTFDDSVTSNSFRLVQGVITNHANPNGHPIKLTFFVSIDSSIEFNLVNRLYADGHEIAVHTMTHTTGTNTSMETFRADIAGCRKALTDFAGVPFSEIVGFRAPFLRFNDNMFRVLGEQGFSYDSTLVEWPGSYSTAPTNYLWPYSLENGLVQSNWTGVFPVQPVAGLVEVPIWANVASNGSVPFLMDPPDSMGSNDLVNLWKTNFLHRYNGNRAPYGLFLHTTTASQWLSNTNYPWRAGALGDFIAWSRSHADVWYLSTRDLVSFMKAPVPADLAAGSSIFQTVTRTPFPPGQVRRCSYPNRSVNICGSCPPAYPRPDTLYTQLDPHAAGVLGVSVLTNAQNRLEYWLSFQNDTTVTSESWTATFEFPTNYTVAGVYASTAAYVTNGGLVRLTITPALYLLPLYPGVTDTNIHFTLNGLASTNVAAVHSQLLDLNPRQPFISGIQACGTDGGSLRLDWTDSAYGYAIDISTNRQGDGWMAVSNVHGSTTWTGAPPFSAGSALIRLRPVP